MSICHSHSSLCPYPLASVYVPLPSIVLLCLAVPLGPAVISMRHISRFYLIDAIELPPLSQSLMIYDERLPCNRNHRVWFHFYTHAIWFVWLSDKTAASANSIAYIQGLSSTVSTKLPIRWKHSAFLPLSLDPLLVFCCLFLSFLISSFLAFSILLVSLLLFFLSLLLFSSLNSSSLIASCLLLPF